MIAIRRGALLLLAAAGSLLPAVARGQPDTAIAEQLFRDGRSLIESGKIDEACEKFAASQRLSPALGTQLNLALCRERQGKTATAWSLFVDAEAAAQRRGDGARTAIAHEHRTALEARLKKIVVDVPAAPPGTVVRLDATILPDAALGTEIPLDPGNHRLIVRAPGKKVWEQSNLSLDSSAATVHLRVELEDDGVPVRGPQAGPPASILPDKARPISTPSPPAPSVLGETPASIPPSRETPSPSPELLPGSGAGARPNVDRMAGFAAGGAGVAFLGVAGYYGLTAISRKNDESHYPAGAPQRRTVYDQAKAAQTWGFVFGGAGIAALGAGASLVAASFHTGAPVKASWELTPSVAPGFAGASLGGSF